MTKSKPLPGKVKPSAKNCLNQNFIIWSFLENGFDEHLKRTFFVFFLQNFEWWTWNHFLENREVGHRKLFRKWFWSDLEIKNKWSEHIWKGKFSGFWQFLSDEFETILWENKTKFLKLFKSKFGQRNLRKWFRSFLELKNQYCGHLKIAFFIFFQVFD